MTALSQRGERAWPGSDRAQSAADADGTETQDYVTARNFAAEALHGSEAGEEQHLVKFMLHVLSARTGKNLVVDHAAILVHGHVHEQAVGKGELGFVLFRSPIAGRIGKRD